MRISKIITSAFLLFSIFHFPFSVFAQVRPVYDLGASGLGQALKRLQTTASAMHTGAHPDDEDSGLLAYLARKEQARAVYLSVTRGDGGQNVIGEELSEQLGVIRTEELLQARRLDGASQMFTRAMDYGFSKTREEAARLWGEQLTLGDMVRAIRLFRPLVVISRFSGTTADGHGQHQFAGFLTPLAFKAAADPNRFPEHFKEGLRPWQAKKFYVGRGFRSAPSDETFLEINTGEFDPLIGRSYFEIAMEGRSQHKSQEMGVLELRGKFISALRLVESFAGKTETERSVFDGIDTSIKGIAALTNNREARFNEKLAELQATAETALKTYDPFNPQKLVPLLAKGYKQAYDAEWSTRNPESKIYLREKQREFAKALQMASGVVIDALSDSETIAAGNSVNVAVKVFVPDGADVKITNVSLKAPENWTSDAAPEPLQAQTGFRPRREDAFHAAFFTLTAPDAAAPTTPYWLEKPRGDNDTFDWSAAGDAKNMPFQKPLASAEIKLEIGGQPITLEREVQYRYADDIRGELRRDLAVVPAVTVGLESDFMIVPASARGEKRRLLMTVTNNMPDEIKGTGTFKVPPGWTLSPVAAEFSLARTGDQATLEFEVLIPEDAKTGSYELTAQAKMAGGKTFDLEMRKIAYPHIQTHRLYSKASIKAEVLDLRVADVKIGYIMGSGDKVPQAIERLGLTVALLGEKELSNGDLSQFDTIIVGIRASQVRPDYVANNERLTEFMKRGGTLVVQYQQQEFVRQNLPPFPAKMDSNVRTVDETAPVTILEPAHAVFNFPNKITNADFAGWVQERNLYTLTSFDEKYTPLLETHDEGETESKGGMLYAEVGKGKFVYTSFSWFRQLPAGNAGAYRIFANIISLPKAGEK